MSELSPADLVDYQAKDSQQALDAALAAVRSYCGWHIAPSQSDTATVFSPDGARLFVQTLNLTAVTSVTQDGVAVDLDTVALERYGVIGRTLGYSFRCGLPVEVVFTHGYAELPADVKDVVLALAQRSISDTRGMVPRTGGAGASMVVMENYGSQLGVGDKAKLAPYTITGAVA